jgi:hypothetical protein
LFQSTYYIDKTSGTFADNLAAFGLAFVLNGVAAGRARVKIEDNGAVFAIHCDPAIQEKWVKKCEFFIGAPFLVTIVDKKTGKKGIKGTSLTTRAFANADGDVAVDYETQKQNRQKYFDWLKSLSPEEKKRKGELQPPAVPHPDWDVFRAINPGSLQGYNAVIAEWWQSKETFAELLTVLLQMTAQTPNDIDSAEKAWAKVCKAHGWDKPKDATASQLLNPAQGKGVNNEKMVFSAPNNIKGFWLLEWLKIVGLFQAGITRTIANPTDPRNAKDRKTYVLMPLHLEWGVHQKVMNDFRKAMVGNATAIKLDVFAALRYTKAFLQHYEEAKTDDPQVELGYRPSDLVSGMQTAFYKSLGQSPAVMNIAAINLPRWVAPRSPEELAGLNESLDEHLAIVRNLDETRGEQFELLRYYRDFMSADDLAPFFKFTNAYSGFVMSQLERRKYVRPFTTKTLEVLFMNRDDSQHTFGVIVQDEGFKNIAYAIRHSTVVPQSRKGKGKKPVVDVRYGLGQQLTRKAAYPAEFLAEIAEFIHLYNAENSQLRENKREPFRKNVTTADIEKLTALVDAFGSKVVCNMLVAYGYAREPYEGKADEPIAEEGEVETPEVDDDATNDDEQ